jgi:uncharacterized membrane protein
MTDNSAPVTITRAPRWMKLLLVVSLTANLAVAGLYLGHRLKGPRDPEDRRVSWVYRVLPEARHDEARAMFAANRGELEAQLEQMQGVHQHIADAIAAEPFDEQALLAAFAARRDQVVKMHATVQGQLVSILEQLTPEERAEVAERVRKGAKRWAERRARLYK